MDDIKLDLAKLREKGCDSSNNREEVYHRLNRAQRDDKKRESKDQIHKSGQYQGKERVTELSSGTGLQEIQHSSANTNTEVLDTAVPSEEGQSASPVDIGKAPQENETVNSSVKKNDRELDGTTQEHNHDQTEMSKKEEDLPKKRAAGSMRNKRTNSEQIR